MPASAQHFPRLRQQLAINLTYAVLLCLQVHHEIDGGEVEKGRNDGREHYVDVTRLEELGHDESRRAHDRRRNLTTRRSTSLHRGGELRPITHLAHQRDREGAGGHYVRDG